MKAIKNTYDMHRINLWEAIPLDTPFTFQIEPTFICNFSCNYCMHALPRKTLEERGFRFAHMDWSVFETVAEHLTHFPSKIKKISFAGFGEPLLDKRLPEMIRILREKNVAENFLVISNGSMLTPELGKELVQAGLTELKISLQGINAIKYNQLCNVNIDFDEFYKNIVHFYKHRGNCKLLIKMADTALDEYEDSKFYEMFGNICDNISIEHIFPHFEGINYNKILRKNNFKNRFGFDYVEQTVCASLFFKLHVLQNGDVTLGYPDGMFYEGFNVSNMTLIDIWNSPEYYQLRRDHLMADFTSHPKCKTCTRWSYSTTPQDSLEGHQKELLERMPDIYSGKRLRKESNQCYENACNFDSHEML